MADLSPVRQDERSSARARRRDGSATDANAAATPPADEARFPRLRKFFDRFKQAGQAAGQVVTDWLSIPRQLRYLAWALVGLAVAYLGFKTVWARKAQTDLATTKRRKLFWNESD